MRLSEFKDEKAIEVVAALLGPISRIAQNKENQEARGEGKSMMDFAIAILKNNATDVKDMLAILADEDPGKYHCSAATVLRDVFHMISDPEMMVCRARPRPPLALYRRLPRAKTNKALNRIL